MTVSFKQFSTFIDASEGEQAPEKLDEIWKSIFAKKKEDEEDDAKSKSKVITAKDQLEKKKKAEEERRKELERKRNQSWLSAKEQAEGRARSPGKSDRDEYALHRTMKEATLNERKTSYSDEGYWKDDAKAAGYKVKKVSGNLMDGDQTWVALNDKDEKVGEFTEKEEDRGGWLIENQLIVKESSRKKAGFFTMSDSDKVLKLDLTAAKEYLIDKIEKVKDAAPENIHKARLMVSKATNVKKLAIDVSNFVLAHEDPKNRVIR